MYYKNSAKICQGKMPIFCIFVIFFLENFHYFREKKNKKKIRKKFIKLQRKFKIASYRLRGFYGPFYITFLGCF